MRHPAREAACPRCRQAANQDEVHDWKDSSTIETMCVEQRRPVTTVNPLPLQVCCMIMPKSLPAESRQWLKGQGSRPAVQSSLLALSAARHLH